MPLPLGTSLVCEAATPDRLNASSSMTGLTTRGRRRRRDADAAIEDATPRSVRAQRHRARERERRRQRRYALAACVIVVLGVYLHCAWSYEKSLDPAPNRRDFHNLIADALLAGQASLTIPVPKLLLHLKNPVRRGRNQPARAQGVHDLSFYKGKLYAYFGPAPAVLLFIPYRILHVGDCRPHSPD